MQQLPDPEGSASRQQAMLPRLFADLHDRKVTQRMIEREGSTPPPHRRNEMLVSTVGLMDKDARMSASSRSAMIQTERGATVQRTKNLRMLIRWLRRFLDKESTLNVVGFVLGGLTPGIDYQPTWTLDVMYEKAAKVADYCFLFPVMMPRRLWQGQPLIEDPAHVIHDVASTDQVARVRESLSDYKHMDNSHWDWGWGVGEPDMSGPVEMYGPVDLKLVRKLLKRPDQPTNARIISRL